MAKYKDRSKITALNMDKQFRVENFRDFSLLLTQKLLLNSNKKLIYNYIHIYFFQALMLSFS